MNKEVFFKELRTGIMGPTLSAEEVSGSEAILAAMAGAPLPWCAYALATAWHETNTTMQPVREAYWLSENWRKRNLRYWPWYGRGYVQLTWEDNYERADDELALNGTLTANPDRAMELPIAAKIMRCGMSEGWFAGDKAGRHTLERHLGKGARAPIDQYTTARRIINGTDKALPIARYALQFQQALAVGGWS